MWKQQLSCCHGFPLGSDGAPWKSRDTRISVHASFDLSVRFCTALVLTPTLPAAPDGIRRFILLLDGEARLAAGSETRALGREGFAFFPDAASGRLSVSAGAKLVAFEWNADPKPSAAPLPLVSGSVADVPRQPSKGDDGLVVQNLLPKQDTFDAEVNVMNFAPGASLSYVETHFMEHGLLFLDGQGIYRLGDRWYPVVESDAIWMGPHELQWFGALGRTPSRYLIWKNFNRRP